MYWGVGSVYYWGRGLERFLRGFGHTDTDDTCWPTWLKISLATKVPTPFATLRVVCVSSLLSSDSEDQALAEIL